MTAPNSPTREMSAQLADILKRLDAIERGRSTQLGNSTLDGTALRVVSPDGTTLASWGVQPDGSASTKNTDPKPLSRPNTPVVTSAVAGLLVEWNGKLIRETPGNFSHVSLHVSPVEGFVASEGNQLGTLREAGVFAVAPLEYVTHYVKLVAWSTSGVASEPSFEQHGSPGKIVADEVMNGIIGELALAEGAVKAAALAAGAVTSTKIGDDAVTTPKIVAGAVQAKTLATGAVTTEKLTADAVTAEKIAALAVTAEALSANSVLASKIAAGAVTATHLAATLVLGNRIIAGDPNGTRVEMSSSGLLVVRDDGDTTFSVDSSTGDVTSMGEYYTSRFGERLAMNSGGLQSPTIRAYPTRGSRYADLRSYTRTTRGVDIANWEFRLPLAPGAAPYEAGLVDFCVYDANFAARNDSRMRYRPFDNGSGVVHPGWAADGQDVAVVFYAGTAYITNSANTARQPLVARGITSQAAMRSDGDFSSGGRCDVGSHATFGLGVKVGETYNAVGGQVTSRELTTLGNASVEGTLFLRNQIVYTSDERLKHRFEALDGSALDAFGEVEWNSWEWLPTPSTDPDTVGPDHRRHVMATAQALARQPLLATAVGAVTGDPGRPGALLDPVEHEEEEPMLAVDLQSIVGIQGAALAEAGGRIRELEGLVRDLRARVEELEPAP